MNSDRAMIGSTSVSRGVYKAVRISMTSPIVHEDTHPLLHCSMMFECPLQLNYRTLTSVLDLFPVPRVARA